MKRTLTLIATLSATLTAAAECATVTVTTDSPFTENFENPDFGCWTQEFVTDTHEWYIYGNQYNGGRSVGFFAGAKGPATRLISPVLDLSDISPALSFVYLNQAWSDDLDTLIVQYRAAESEAWTPVDTLRDDVTDWTGYSVTLPAAAASATCQIGLLAKSGYGYGAHVDALRVYDNNGLHKPTIKSPHPLRYQITAEWESQPAATEYEIGVVAGSSTPTADELSALTVYKTTGTSYTLTGLTSNKQYVVCLRASDGTRYSDWAFASTRTLSPKTAFTGTTVWADSIQVRWAAQEGCERIRVVCSLTELSETERESAAYTTAEGTATRYTCTGLLSGTTYHIYLLGEYTDGPGTWTYIDITTNTKSVDRLHVTAIGATTATVGWTPYAEGESEYKTFTSTTAVSSVDQLESACATYTDATCTKSLSGLTPDTPYYFYIRPAGSSERDWSGFVLRTLGDTPVAVTDTKPYFEGFESGVMPWSYESEHGTNAFRLTGDMPLFINGVSYASGDYVSRPTYAGDRAMYIYDFWKGAVTAAYTPLFDLSTLTDPELSFQYRNSSWSSDQDSMRVYYQSGEGDWVLLGRLTDNTEEYTQAVFSLPDASASYRLKFQAYSEYGIGVIIDNVNLKSAKYSGVTAATANRLRVTPGESRITVSGATEAVYLYTVSGALVTRSAASETITLPAKRGVYIVRTGGETVKVLVR